MSIRAPSFGEQRLYALTCSLAFECHRAGDFTVALRESASDLGVGPRGTARALCAFASACTGSTSEAEGTLLARDALWALLAGFALCAFFAGR
jgi:hypothetical protein